jgi:hypothetical protein
VTFGATLTVVLVVGRGAGAEDDAALVGVAGVRIVADGEGRGAVLDGAGARLEVGALPVLAGRVLAGVADAAGREGRGAGRYAGCGIGRAVTDGRVTAVGLLCARPMPRATAAQPATASDATQVDRIRLQDMWQVCQV